MANLNRVLLIGNLTRDPEVRYTPKGTAVADIGMAINRIIGGSDDTERREEVTYVDVTLWGRQAEIAQQYLTKGRGVFIEGRLQLDSWDDKQTGQKRSKLKVVAENMQLLGSRAGSGGEGEPGAGGERPSGGERTNPPRRGSASGGAAPAPRPARDPDLDAEPDDIPF
jgi:single-strand DNA-binding protein